MSASSILKNATILVTGGEGFLGSQFIHELVDHGYSNIYSIDNLMGVPEQFRIKTHKDVNVIIDSITETEVVSKIFEAINPAYVVHFAANGNVPLSHTNPSLDFNSNALGTFNLVQHAIQFNVKKFVYASSAAVYGKVSAGQTNEAHPCQPISNYGVSKYYGEQLGMMSSKTYNLPFISIRIFNSYGPKQSRYVIHDLYKKLKLNPEKLEVLGTGNQIRDYAYAADTARAFRLAMESEASGEIYNISGGVPISISTVVEELCSVMNASPDIFYTGHSWTGDLDILTADISKISNELGYEASVPFKTGLQKTIQWFDENISYK